MLYQGDYQLRINLSIKEHSEIKDNELEKAINTLLGSIDCIKDIELVDIINRNEGLSYGELAEMEDYVKQGKDFKDFIFDHLSWVEFYDEKELENEYMTMCIF